MNEKHALAILGSPHTNGITAAMLNCAIRRTEELGYTITKINLYEKNLSYHTPSPFSWIFGQSRGAIRNMDEFFKTAGMKPIGKIVCAGTANKKELPRQIIKKIEKCMK